MKELTKDERYLLEYMKDIRHAITRRNQKGLLSIMDEIQNFVNLDNVNGPLLNVYTGLVNKAYNFILSY